MNNFKEKYLDEDDIKELGWKLTKNYEIEQEYQMFPFEDMDNWYELLIEYVVDDYPYITVEKWKDEEKGSNFNTLFKGQVRNYNELKRIMKQII